MLAGGQVNSTLRCRAVLASTYRRVPSCILDVSSSIEIVWSAANEKGLATQQILKQI
jgi:hypothetical protein